MREVHTYSPPSAPTLDVMEPFRCEVYHVEANLQQALEILTIVMDRLRKLKEVDPRLVLRGNKPLGDRLESLEKVICGGPHPPTI